MIDGYDDSDIRNSTHNVEKNNSDAINKRDNNNSLEKEVHVGIIKSSYGPKELKLMSELNSKAYILENEKGQKYVELKTIEFSGKRNIDWKKVQDYLSRFTKCSFKINETNEKIHIGNDFPMEVKGSIDTIRLKGGDAKAKANILQALPYLIEIATNKRHQDNFKSKHSIDAKGGWDRYTVRCHLPVFNEQKEIERFNLYRAELLIRNDINGEKYLYDVVNVKKDK